MNPPTPKKRILKPLQIIAEFIRLESSSGIILFIAAVAALFIANSPLGVHYQHLLHTPIGWEIGQFNISTTVIFLIDDLLMAVFFLLVGLEIKREVLLGELNSLAKVSLPGIAALGGMIAPALIYTLFNHNDSFAMRGWAIPTATDIAFALGIMALVGKRIPLSVKLFLMALAIFDDIGAIIIIAVFYVGAISWVALGGAGLCVALLWLQNKMGVTRLWPYLLLGAVLWVLLLKSGIHPTLAGVLLALTIPIKEGGQSPLHLLERKLHPWVAYAILPLFSFANAGISFAGFKFGELFTPLSVGIMAGLFLGKPIGVFISTWLAVRFRIAPMPKDANWLQIFGVAVLCGVGFTMSLFIGQLAFDDVDSGYPVLVRFGVIMGSFLAGICGYYLLRLGTKRHNKPL
ncbi:MAG TPA: Na+/H+ antiporter NhaA [Gammaproteobacteria bacterium]|nr:Na+/H+ antiporter NhaA [Gammaproteobacteria bacterium]